METRTTSQDGTLRVLQLTDPHLFADPAANLRGTVTNETLDEVIEHYNASDWQADVVYLTGDLVQDDTAEAYRQLCAKVDTLGKPTYVVPGNHDVPHLFERELAEYRRCATLKTPGWRLIGIDTQEPGSAGGRLGSDELARLDALLAEDDPRPVAIFMHHPPVELGSRWLDAVGLADREDFLALIERSPTVRILVFGHVHQAYDNESNTLRIIGTPSTGRQFLPHADEFAVDDRPPAYRRLEFGDDGSFTTQLVWIADA